MLLWLLILLVEVDDDYEVAYSVIVDVELGHS